MDIMKLKLQDIIRIAKKTKHHGIFIPFSNILINYGSRLMSQRMIQDITTRRNISIQNKLHPYLPVFPDKPASERSINNGNIWVCWLQGEEQLPLIPQLCLKSIKKNANGHNVIVLDATNISDYVQLPEYVWRKFKKGDISPAHFSDILRMELLRQHGGFWIDATIFLTSPIPDEIFNSSYYTVKLQPFGNYISQCRWSGFFQWSKPHSPVANIVSQMFRNYWAKESTLLDYFFIDHAIDMAYKSNESARMQIDEVPFNNPNLYKLQSLLLEPFSQQLLGDICKDTFAFKLNWKSYTDLQLKSSPNNFYSKLLELADS